MNDKEKMCIHIGLREALETEQISQKVAGDCLGINQGYVSIIKVGTNLKAVPTKIWDRLKPWASSGLPITAFMDGVLIHQGNVERPVEDKTREAEAVPTHPDEKIIDTIDPVTLESRASAFMRFQEGRMVDVKLALRRILNEGDVLPMDWVKEYNDLWETINR